MFSITNHTSRCALNSSDIPLTVECRHQSLYRIKLPQLKTNNGYMMSTS